MKLSTCVTAAALAAACGSDEPHADSASNTSIASVTLSVQSASSRPTATSAPAAAPAATVTASPDGDAYSLAAAGARGAGVGFRISGFKGSGLSRVEGADWLLAFSGPPGGPLGLQLSAYTQRPSLEAAYEKLETRRPYAKGSPETFEVAGSKRSAMSFRAGSSLATTCTCIVDLPASAQSSTGLLLSFDTGCPEKNPPSTCAQLAEHPTLKPVLRTLQLAN